MLFLIKYLIVNIYIGHIGALFMSRGPHYGEKGQVKVKKIDFCGPYVGHTYVGSCYQYVTDRVQGPNMFSVYKMSTQGVSLSISWYITRPQCSSDASFSKFVTVDLLSVIVELIKF